MSTRACLTLAIAASFALTPIAQTTPEHADINPALLTARWQAQWITHQEARDQGVYLFRKAFELADKPERFVVHVSADQRYELFANGTRIALGPARGDLDHWRFETVDLAPVLKPGRNTLAAIVWHFGEHAPMAQVSHRTAFVLQGDGEVESAVNTGTEWSTASTDAWTLLPVDRASIFHQYFVSGPGEEIDASRHLWGWEQPEFDASGWTKASVVGPAAPRAILDSPSRWFLVPRGIPPMEDGLDRFERVARSDGAAVPAGLLEGGEPWRIPAHTTTTVLIDRAKLTTAYPELVTSGGRGATIDLTYAEALYMPREDGRRGDKGNRDEVEGKIVRGLRDRFLPDGGAGRVFRPLWWRTYRYVQVEIATGDEPLTVDDLRGRFTAYPFELKATFASSDPTLRTIFDIGWWTVRLCAHETYMDTPYWEQLQYIGDTRIQALVTLYLTGDDTMVRHAIALFDESRIPDGLTQSRYPTELPQLIPPFSLFWIGMLHDHWWFTGDKEHAAAYLGGARGVLDWFEDRLLPNGLLGAMEWWNYADWVPDWQRGLPPMLESGGQSALLSLQYALALREAADLEEARGGTVDAAHYRSVADRVVDGVRRQCWDAQRGLFADTPARTEFSQHVNSLAILADLVPPGQQRVLMEKVVEDETLTQATYYFKFYVFRALVKAGLGERYLELLQPWREMIDLGLTTWAERPEPTRSDSHAWSSHPSVDLLGIVSGVRPATPGFTTVRIEPHLGSLESVTASIPTPRGTIRVQYTRTGTSLTGQISLPPDTSGTLVWGSDSVPLRAGSQAVTLPASSAGANR